MPICLHTESIVNVFFNLKPLTFFNIFKSKLDYLSFGTLRIIKIILFKRFLNVINFKILILSLSISTLLQISYKHKKYVKFILRI